MNPIERLWESYQVDGCDLFILKDKFKGLERDLKVWNKEVFKNLNCKRKKIFSK